MPGYTLVPAVGGSAPTFGLGDFVKLMFNGRHGAESMWVNVTAIAAAGLAGTLANAPLCCDGLDFGDEVRFGREHVIDTRPGGDVDV